MSVAPEHSSGSTDRRDSDRFDPFALALHEDPYPVYAAFRRDDPVHLGRRPMPSMPRCWYLFRYADVVSALHDDRLGRERRGAGAPAAGLPSASTVIRRMARRMALFTDPPRHERLRAALEAAWDKEITRRIDVTAAELARRLLDEALAGPEVELMSQFCVPLAVLTMADALGVPARDRLRIKRWSTDIVALTDLHLDAAALDRAGRATAEVVEYLRDILAERRRRPRIDLLSGMVAPKDRALMLEEEEVLANALLLLAAGHETTVGLLGNGLLALLQNPTAFKALSARPQLIPRCVEEMLRYDSPIQMTFRTAHTDVELGGRTVARGEAVALVLGSANRDATVFPRADSFVTRRSPNAHLAFGGGRHTCYGAALARREARAAMRVLVPHLEKFQLVEDAIRRSNNVLFRSLARLPVRVA